MFGKAGEHLPFQECHAEVDEVPPEILYEAVLLSTVGERLDDVPERGWIARTAEGLFRGRAIGVKTSKTLIKQFLQLGECGPLTRLRRGCEARVVCSRIGACSSTSTED